MCCFEMDLFPSFAIYGMRKWFELDQRVAEADALLKNKKGPRDVETEGNKRRKYVRK